MSGAGGDGGCGWSVCSGFSLPFLSSHTFPLLQHGFSTGTSWNQLCPTLGQPPASSQRGHRCQHLHTVTHYTDRPQRCIWACPLAGLSSPSHCSTFFLCIWAHQDRLFFPAHGIAAWEKGSSSTLPAVTSQHTDDWLLVFCCCLLLWIILQLWISLCTYCAESFFLDLSEV